MREPPLNDWENPLDRLLEPASHVGKINDRKKAIDCHQVSERRSVDLAPLPGVQVRNQCVDVQHLQAWHIPCRTHAANVIVAVIADDIPSITTLSSTQTCVPDGVRDTTGAQPPCETTPLTAKSPRFICDARRYLNHTSAGEWISTQASLRARRIRGSIPGIASATQPRQISLAGRFVCDYSG